MVNVGLSFTGSIVINTVEVFDVTAVEMVDQDAPVILPLLLFEVRSPAVEPLPSSNSQLETSPVALPAILPNIEDIISS